MKKKKRTHCRFLGHLSQSVASSSCRVLKDMDFGLAGVSVGVVTMSVWSTSLESEVGELGDMKNPHTNRGGPQFFQETS